MKTTKTKLRNLLPMFLAEFATKRNFLLLIIQEQPQKQLMKTSSVAYDKYCADEHKKILMASQPSLPSYWSTKPI